MECRIFEDSHQFTMYHKLSRINQESLGKSEKICSRSGVRLLTYNIFLRPPPIKNNEDDYKNERIEDFCKVINDFDIICLQEMFGTYNSRKQELIRAAARQGFFFFVDTPTPFIFSHYMIDGGLLILSRFPIVETCFYPFTYGVLADSLAEKGVLYAKIQIANRFLHLMTTHLQASYFDSTDFEWNLSFETRYTQLIEVNKIAKEIMSIYYKDRKDKILLVGDFNVDAQRYKFKLPSNSNNLDQLIYEYDCMLDTLCDKDVIFRDFFTYNNIPHPITYGEREDEDILTYINDRGSKQTLDYIFEIFMGEEDEAMKDKKEIEIDLDSIRVEKFLVKEYPRLNNDKKQRVYKTLSDHYGLSVELKINTHKLITSRCFESDQNDNSKNVVIDVSPPEDEVRLIVES